MTEPKQRYIISLRYMLHGIVIDYITKPMTEDDFDTDIRGRIREGLFPIIIPCEQAEHIEKGRAIWDEFVYTEAHFKDPNIHFTLGVWHDG